MNLKKIHDSDKREQFVMNLLLTKKGECPKTGTWEIKGDKLFNNGNEVATLSGDLANNVNIILSSISKVSDSTVSFYDDMETNINILEALLPDISINEVDGDKVYIPRPLTPQEVDDVDKWLQINLPLEVMNKPGWYSIN